MSEKVENEANTTSGYAIIKTGGKQYRVSEGERLLVEKLAGAPGDILEIKEVLAFSKDGVAESTKWGAPILDGATVSVKVLGEVKEKKVTIYKKRRRKGYTKKQGHRQGKTEIVVERITA